MISVQNNTYKSKHKENEWLNKLWKEDLWFNANNVQNNYANMIKGSNCHSVKFTTKKCIVCKLRFDGSGTNQVELPIWFERVPMKVALCSKHKPDYKVWFHKNKENIHKKFGSRNIGPESEEAILYWYKKEKNNGKHRKSNILFNKESNNKKRE
tara:strand:- start:40 stop:501 length:462 start_codon:yes stop_codon:yes gene_type:complete